MSTVEEDVELRDLVAQTLEKNGCLAKLRAELRASIFLALDEDIKLSKQQPLQNRRIQSYLETPEGRAMFGLVREFLDFFNLQFTISVYEPESYFESIGQYEGRQKIAQDLGLDNIEESTDPTVPLLQQLLKIAQAKNKILDINLNVNSNVNGSYIDESLNIDSSYKKTETYNNTLSKSSSNNDTKLESDLNNESGPIGIENPQFLNNTFDINGPTINFSHLSKITSENVPSKYVLKDVIREEYTFEDNSRITQDIKALENSNKSFSSITNDSQKNQILSGEKNGNLNYGSSRSVNASNIKQNNIENGGGSELKKKAGTIGDDTYEDTSSIAEDSEALANSNSSKTTENPGNEVPFITPTTITNSNETAPQPPTNTAKAELEKPKLSLQRPKSSLSSLTDLPPLSINKSRVSNDILPSLYSKEFKNKSNLKELDKMFDMDADYEEDFIYSSNELSLNSPCLNSSQSKNSLLEEPGITNKMDSEKLNIFNKKEPKKSNKSISDAGKSLFRPPVPKTCSSLLKTGEHSNIGSINEHSLSD